MSDSDDEGGLWRYGSILIPLADAWPSSAINGAVWNPATFTITIDFKSGGVESYDCGIDTWLAYKASGSRGSFYNANFRQSSQSQSQSTPAKAGGINRTPYGKRK